MLTRIEVVVGVGDAALVELLALVNLGGLGVPLVTGLVDAAVSNVGVSRHDCFGGWSVRDWDWKGFMIVE